MAEQLTCQKPHLEEPEILAVPGVRSQVGLAARHRERVVAGRAEHAADRRRRGFGLSGREATGESLPPVRPSAAFGEDVFGNPETSPVRCDLPLGLRRESRVAEEPRVMDKEAKRLAVSPHRVHGRRNASGGRGRRRREGERGRDEQQRDGTSAQPQGSQNMTSWSVTGTRHAKTDRSCRSVKGP